MRSRRSRRSSIIARILAPLALVAAGLAVWMVVQGGGIDGKKSTISSATTVKVKPKKVKKKYTVKRGDVLSAISVKYGVSIDRIRELNPDLDANALRAGEVIRLHR